MAIMSTGTQRRHDLHNSSIDFQAATEGLCGFTHIPTGRVCRLRCRHPGPCDLRARRPDASTPESSPSRRTADSRQSSRKEPS